MTTSSTATIDQKTADRLSAGFHRCFAEFTAAGGLFAGDAFFDVLPPMWRFQFEGSGAAFAAQLQSRFGWPLHVIEDCRDDPAVEQPEAFLDALCTAIATSTTEEER